MEGNTTINDIQEQADYLNLPTAYYLRRYDLFWFLCISSNRWRRDYIAVLLLNYIDDIKLKESLKSADDLNKVKDAVIDQMKKEKDNIEAEKEKWKDELVKERELNEELLRRNDQLRIFLNAALDYIQAHMALFIGYLVFNGVALKLGFKMEDCIGENSPLAQWIRSLNVDDLESGQTPLLSMFQESMSLTKK